MTDENKEELKKGEAPSASEEENKEKEKKDDKKTPETPTSQDDPLKKELENIDKSKQLIQSVSDSILKRRKLMNS